MKNLRDKKLAEQILLEISDNLPNNKDIDLSTGYIYDINLECNYVIKAIRQIKNLLPTDIDECKIIVG